MEEMIRAELTINVGFSFIFRCSSRNFKLLQFRCMFVMESKAGKKSIQGVEREREKRRSYHCFSELIVVFRVNFDFLCIFSKYNSSWNGSEELKRKKKK